MKKTNVTKNKKPFLLLAAIIAIFIIGILIGYGKQGQITKAEFSDDTCFALERNIRNNTHNAEILRTTSEIFAVNCRTLYRPKPTPDSWKKPLPERTCEAVEVLVLKNIEQFPPRSNDTVIRFVKAESYARLSNMGCPENRDIFRDLAVRELELGLALYDDFEGCRENLCRRWINTLNLLRRPEQARAAVARIRYYQSTPQAEVQYLENLTQ